MVGGQAPRIVIHAGFHKTGTTSIQAALKAHRRHLAPQLATMTRYSRPAFAEAANAARDFSAHPEDARRTTLAARLAAWADGIALSPGQGLVASSEDLSGHMPGAHGLTRYSAAAGVAQMVAGALRARFGPGLELRFVYTTRGAEDWLRSIHWQLSRHPEMKIFAERFARDFAGAANFSAVLEEVRAAFPAGMVREVALEDVAGRRLGPVEALYDVAGLEPAIRAKLKPARAENVSPPYDLSGAYVALNRARIPRRALRRLKLALLASAELDRETGECDE